MTWQPLTEEELHEMLNSAWQRMSLPQRRLWEAIRIEPQKWASHPYGDLGGGFWAVALLGQTVVWFNDIEDGFNRSHYTNHGTIGAYWCNQDQLEWTISAPSQRHCKRRRPRTICWSTRAVAEQHMNDFPRSGMAGRVA